MQWITVEEQLPTEGENILFVERYGDEPIICYGYYGQDGRWYDATNIDHDGSPMATHVSVSHWMPLPDPPE